MKFISGGIQHETNTFSNTPTQLEDFIRDSHCGPELEGGSALVGRMAGTGTIHGGYLAETQRRGIELVPLLSLRAQPSGVVADACFDRVLGEFLDRLERQFSCDGILLDLHGAMVTESHEDAEGAFIAAVRGAVGDTPIVATLDLHANITPQMAAAADVLIGFDTYPHVDMRERGEEAVSVLAQIAAGELEPEQTLRQLPLLTMPPMQCTLREPMQSLMSELHALERRPGIATATLAMGFPFADIHDAGVAVLVTAHADRALAEACADEFSDRVWSLREQLQPQLTPIAAAIDWVRRRPDASGPLIFADGSDNPGGGAPCDGTVALRALLDADLPGAAVGVLFDPDTAAEAHAAGVGATIQAQVGGKTDQRHGETILCEATVEQLSDGRFRYHGEMMQGVEESMGPSARLRIGNIQVVVSSIRRQCLDTAMLRSVGLEPADCRLLVLKSAVHFRADFGPLAAKMVDGDTPGIHRPDFSCFQYHHVRRPICPLDAPPWGEPWS